MKIKVTAVRFKDLPLKSGMGTWRKFECKTDKTGDAIIEMQLGKTQNDKVKVGDIVDGYIADSTYVGQSGIPSKVLRAISAQYVYELLLKFAPGIENNVASVKTAAVDGFGGSVKTPKQDEWTVSPTDSGSHTSAPTAQPGW